MRQNSSMLYQYCEYVRTMEKKRNLGKRADICRRENISLNAKKVKRMVRRKLLGRHNVLLKKCNLWS